MPQWWLDPLRDARLLATLQVPRRRFRGSAASLCPREYRDRGRRESQQQRPEDETQLSQSDRLCRKQWGIQPQPLLLPELGAQLGAPVSQKPIPLSKLEQRRSEALAARVPDVLEHLGQKHCIPREGHHQAVRQRGLVWRWRLRDTRLRAQPMLVLAFDYWKWPAGQQREDRERASERFLQQPEPCESAGGVGGPDHRAGAHPGCPRDRPRGHVSSCRRDQLPRLCPGCESAGHLHPEHRR
mmetsp:Transcript_92149/g.127931  ORF Transcript_92149/g.127931 Transcript_92149/m.127931 type:complete len:241 (-) Transcript_92149:479-1201(-)